MGKTERAISIVAIVLLVGVIIALGYYVFFVKMDNDKKAYDKIRISYEVRDYASSLKMITDFFVDYPESPYRFKTFNIAADILIAQSEFERAKNYLNKNLSTASIPNQDFVGSVKLLGKILRQSGKYDQVIHNYLENAYLKAGPEDKPEVAAFIGYANLYKGDLQTAISYFNRGSGEYAVLGRAQVYLAQGNKDSALTEYENFFNAYSPTGEFADTTDTYLNLAYNWAMEQKQKLLYDASVKTFLRIINRFPSEAYADSALFEIADVYYINKQYGVCIDFLNRTLENSATQADDDALYERGLAYLQLGQKKEAYQDFKRLMEVYPQSEYFQKAADWLKASDKPEKSEPKRKKKR